MLIIWCSPIAVFQTAIAGEGDQYKQDRAKTTFIAIVAVLDCRRSFVWLSAINGHESS
ncbi:hypothetical protein NC651_021410 [Populus alba x Populus x berolinensis]|nr:hypothetical protein NC651_021410 [Populus alba x Populus x berolinensis]